MPRFGSKGVPKAPGMSVPFGAAASGAFKAPAVQKAKAPARIAKPRGGKMARLAGVKI